MMHYLRSTTELFTEFQTTASGLKADQLEPLRLEYGPNQLPVKKKSLLKLLVSQFNDVLVYILLGALALSIIAPILEGHASDVSGYIDALVIFAILFLNAMLGFVQKYKAEEAINLLEKLTAPTVRVKRDNQEKMIPGKELLPGDIVLIEAGDRISADGRLIEVSHLEMNESSLTGESQLVEKNTDTLKGKLATADQKNMVFSGTLVSAGSGVYIVTAIGIQTEIGKVAALVASTEIPETPLQKKLGSLGKKLGAMVMLLCVAVIGIGLIKQMSFIDILMIAVSLAVSAVPEGLPAVITVCFALGVKRMVGKNALVRRLDALETLGSVTVICSDKTGTITQNKMSVVDTWLADDYPLELLGTIGASCNRAQLPDLGDPTEIGLLEFAAEKNIERSAFDEEEVPFNSTDKYMQTRHGNKSYIKGAPEKVIELCTNVNKDAATSAQDAFAVRGLRVLGCAIKEGDSISFVGLLALEDPPRPTAKESIRLAGQAGIRCIMITGDNPITASAIASQVGIEGATMIGAELDSLSTAQLAEAVKVTSVFARVSPTHKLKILHALQKNGEVVAMSGDGVNDAPALKGAHVGISMGKVGTQVAREASSIVLADDNFSTIVVAIKEGRRIYDNIRKFVLLLLRANFDELLFIMTTLLLSLPLPYLPLHILWINLVTDGLPALALGMEKAEPDVMERPPRNRNEGILEGEWPRLLLSAFVGFLLSFVLYLYLLDRNPSDSDLPHIRSVLLTMAILFELLQAHNVRSKLPIWKIGFFSNKWLIAATAIPFVLHIILLYSPLATFFKVEPLTLKDWLLAGSFALVGFLLFELLKVLKLRPKKILQTT